MRHVLEARVIMSFIHIVTFHINTLSIYFSATELKASIR